MVIRRVLCISLLFLFSLLSVVQADITVKADREQIAVGENFTLTFSSDRQTDGPPDFTPLNQHFQILGTGQNTSFQSLNGRVNRFFSWEVEVVANNEGTIEIPPINFGSEQSPALTLTILKEPPATSGSKKDDVFIEITTEPEQPYVQQQMIVHQRLLHAVPLSNSQASLTHPEWGNGQGDISPLGDAKYSSEVRNGVRYQVIERRYAAFPRSSGEASIAPTVFEGVVDDDPNSNDIFGMSGKLIRRVSKPFNFKVLPQPTAIKGNWLPAKSITLNAYWEPNSTAIKAGDPVTLTLAIMADGLMAEQLPALKITPPNGLKAYSDRPNFENKKTANGIVGVRQEKWTVVGTADGQLVWPEIALNWWNTQKNQAEVARLPAKTLTVSGAGIAAKSLPKLVAPATNAEKPVAEEAKPAAAAELAEPAISKGHLYWPQLLAVTLGLLGFGIVLFTLKRSWQQRGQTPALAPTRANTSKTNANAWSILQHACQRNDAPVALDALQRWLKEETQLTPPTLANLRTNAPMALQRELDSLNTVLYAPKQQISWQGQGLYQALQSFRQSLRGTQGQEVDSELAVLYPD